jgi:hypothetical protein
MHTTTTTLADLPTLATMDRPGTYRLPNGRTVYGPATITELDTETALEVTVRRPNGGMALFHFPKDTGPQGGVQGPQRGPIMAIAHPEEVAYSRALRSVETPAEYLAALADYWRALAERRNRPTAAPTTCR